MINNNDIRDVATSNIPIIRSNNMTANYLSQHKTIIFGDSQYDFLNNSHTKEYIEIYNKSKEQLFEGYDLSYFEKHHFIPKCLGGTNHPDNIVSIPYQLHIYTHYLLTKMVKKDTYQWRQLSLAFGRMVDGNDYQERNISNEMILSDLSKISKKQYRHSEETRDIMKEKAVGRKSFNRKRTIVEGIVFDSITEAADYFKVNRKTIRYWIKNGGKPTKEITKNKLRKISKEKFKNKKNHPMYGVKRTKETKEKISNSNKGKVPTNRKMVKINGIIYESIMEASRKLDFHHTTIRRWIKIGKAKLI